MALGIKRHLTLIKAYDEALSWKREVSMQRLPDFLLEFFLKVFSGNHLILLGSNLNYLLEESAVCRELPEVLTGFSFECVESVQLNWSWKGKQLEKSVFPLHIQPHTYTHKTHL